MAYKDDFAAITGLDYWWELDGDETDSVGSANSDGGTDPSWVTSIVPEASAYQCGDYNGSSSETLIPNQTDINSGTTTQKSIHAWVVIDTIDTSNGGRIIWGEGGSSNSLALYVYNNGGTPTLYFDVCESSTHDTISWTGVNTGTLYFISAIMDATNGALYLYVNGSMVASKTGGLNISTSFSAHSAGIAIGGVDSNLKNHAGSALSGFFDGRIADVGYVAEATPTSLSDHTNIYNSGMGAQTSYNQASFRGRNDDGSEIAATWKDVTNANFSQIIDANFRIRFLVQEENDAEDSDVQFQLQYNLNSGGWNDVTGASSVVRSSASPYVTDGVDTTQQIGSGTFVTPNDGFDEVNGIAGGTDLDFTTTVNQEVELEFCVQIRSADTSGGDTVQLRLWNEKSDSVLETYTNTPSITVVSQSYVQASFRGRNDDESEIDATWIAAVNTNFTQVVDTNFRIRFLVQETNDVADADVQFQLQYNHEGGGWNDVNGSSSVVRSFASTYLTDGEDTTQQLGSGTYITNNDCVDEANGLVGGANLDFTTTANQEVEAEFCIQIRDTDTDPGDQIQLRLVKEADELFSTYTNIPIITIPSPPSITSVGGDDQFSNEEEDVEIIGANFYTNQGTGKVELCPSSTYGSAVEQTVVTWSSTSIDFDVVMGGLSTGPNYVFVTNSDNLRNATGFAVVITAAPINYGLWKTASIQGTITNNGFTVTAFLVSDE